MAQRGIPEGNAFLLATPKSDRFLDQMYAQQQQRDALRQKEDTDLDSLLQKEIGKTRSVDQPEIINQYQQYKALKKQLYSDKKLQRDPLRYNQVKTEADRLQQGIMQVGKGSEELTGGMKELIAEQRKNPYAFKEDFNARVAALMNTPYSMRQKHPLFGDLSNFDSYYDHDPNLNWEKVISDAKGKADRVIGVEKTPIGEKGFQYSETPLTDYKKAEDVKASLVNAAGETKLGRAAKAQWSEMLKPENKAEREAELVKFINTPPEKLQALGYEGLPDILPKNPDNLVDSWASYEAIKDFNNRLPVRGATKTVDNKEAIFNAKTAAEKLQDAIEFGRQKELINLRNTLKAKSPEEQDGLMEKWYNDRIEEAMTPAKGDEKAKSVVVIRKKGGGQVAAYPLNLAPAFEEQFQRTVDGKKIRQDAMTITKDGDIIPIYYKRQIVVDPVTKKETLGEPIERNGAKVIDMELTKPIPKAQGKAVFGGKLLTKAANKTELADETDEGPKIKSTKKGELDDLE